MDKKFTFPHELTMDNLSQQLQVRGCLVVSFFGKTPHSARSNKGSFIDDVTGRQIFSVSEPSSSAVIEGFFDPDRDIVFLHMTSWMDTYTIGEKCKVAVLIQTRAV